MIRMEPFRECSCRRLAHRSQIAAFEQAPIHQISFINGISISTNGIRALAEYPHLTGLGIVCGSGPKKEIAAALPCLSNLHSLEMAQTAYQANGDDSKDLDFSKMVVKICGWATVNCDSHNRIVLFACWK